MSSLNNPAPTLAYDGIPMTNGVKALTPYSLNDIETGNFGTDPFVARPRI